MEIIVVLSKSEQVNANFIQSDFQNSLLQTIFAVVHITIHFGKWKGSFLRPARPWAAEDDLEQQRMKGKEQNWAKSRERETDFYLFIFGWQVNYLLGTNYALAIVAKVKDKGALRHEDNNFKITNKTRKARDKEKNKRHPENKTSSLQLQSSTEKLVRTWQVRIQLSTVCLSMDTSKAKTWVFCLTKRYKTQGRKLLHNQSCTLFMIYFIFVNGIAIYILLCNYSLHSMSFLYQFQVGSIVARLSFGLQSVHSKNSSGHLAP